MGITSALNAGVMGLNVNSAQLNALADNIANSGTNGYKRTNVDFASVVTGQISGSYDAGGVRATANKEVTSEGSLLTTNNSTDLAISGEGMLPVTSLTSRDEPAGVRPTYLVSTGSFNVDAEGFLVTSSGLQLLGWPTDSTGAVGTVIRASGASLEPVNVAGFDFASDPSTEVDLGVNLPAADANGTAGTAYSSGIEYFDSLGNAQTLTVTFTTTATANQWTLSVADSATTTNPISVHTLTFHDTGANSGFLDTVANVSGDAYVAATGKIPLLVDNDASTLNLEIGIEDVVGKLSQFASSYAPTGIVVDGSTVGNLSSVEVNENGFVQAIYDSGFRQTIYQIPVAAVPNPNGLNPIDNQAFAVSESSGGFFLWDAGDGPTGAMLGFTLEQSASDIGTELTMLIETQRAYSSNAKIIQTVDEMLQETTNLKR